MKSPEVIYVVWYTMVSSIFEIGKVLPFLPLSTACDVSAEMSLLLLRKVKGFDSKAANRHEHLDSGTSFMLPLKLKLAE